MEADYVAYLGRNASRILGAPEMPSLIGNAPPPTPERTLAEVLRGTGQGQFGMSVFRMNNTSLVARFDGAAVDHFENAALWLSRLCGGGIFELQAHRRINYMGTEVEWNRFYGPAQRVSVPGALAEVNLAALQGSDWYGPPILVYPQRGETVERTQGVRQGVPKLQEPLAALTIGFDQKAGMSSPMVDGRAGGVMRSNGYFERAFLFGEPEGNDDQQFAHPFAFGQGGREGGYTMPGVMIWVNRDASKRTHLSREVLRASSGAHLDVRVMETIGQTLAGLRGEVQETHSDALVALYQVLERLLHTPLVGYQLNPVIAFKRDDELRIDGVPTGMRLFLVGVVEATL